MKFTISIIILIALLLPIARSFAHDKKPKPIQTTTVAKQTQTPEMFQIITRIAKGTRFESQDAKNVSFTLKPNRAFITIEF